MRPAGDDKLIRWHKLKRPFIPLPPSNMPLTGWRDPFIFEKGGPGREWTLLIGSGVKGAFGAVLVYKSSALTAGAYEHDAACGVVDVCNTTSRGIDARI